MDHLPAHSSLAPRVVWNNIVLAAVMMLATLPGRTQGLGLITEPLLRDLRLDPLAYAAMNTWATLLGAALCLPIGWVLDRRGLRWPSVAIVLLLGAVVYGLSLLSTGGAAFFALLLLTRALGQSALSVASITLAGKSAGDQRNGWAMGVYAGLLSIFMAAAFVGVGQLVLGAGWRAAWGWVALALVAVVAPAVALLLREPPRAAVAVGRAGEREAPAGGVAAVPGQTLGQALGTPVFWIFSGGICLFNLVASGLGLFNEAVLAERGFDAGIYHKFLGATTLCALAGQFLCGWLLLRHSLARLLGAALFLYAAGLAALPWLQNLAQLWSFAAVFGLAGGFIIVIFFAAWGQVFGRAHLGRIQGAAQMLTVLASAVGPLLFAACHARYGSYAPVLFALAGLVFVFGLGAFWLRLPNSQVAKAF